jgi:hypothetical protein
MKTNYEALLEMGWEELHDRDFVRLTYTPDIGHWKAATYYRIPYVTQWIPCMTITFIPANVRCENIELNCDEICSIRYQAVLDFRSNLKKLYTFLQDSED